MESGTTSMPCWSTSSWLRSQALSVTMRTAMVPSGWWVRTSAGAYFRLGRRAQRLSLHGTHDPAPGLLVASPSARLLSDQGRVLGVTTVVRRGRLGRIGVD